jgi:hypothetical protein
MHTNDAFWKITPPATLADLAALDATREVPYLKARCARMGIRFPAQNPTPTETLPLLESRLAEHNKLRSRFLSDCSGDYIEWKLIKEVLEEFIAYLRKLKDSPAPKPSSSAQNQDNPLNPPTNQKPEPAKPSAPESKPNQNRENSGTHAGPRRDMPGTAPGQKRDKPGQENQNPKKPSQNPQNPKHETTNSCGTTGTQPNNPPAPPKPDPDPNTVDIGAYLNAYFEKHGPPSRERLDKKSPELQRYILTLIEDMPLRKAQHKLMLPPPYGPYIATSKSALTRLRNRHHTLHAIRNKHSIQKHITDLLAQPDLPDADVTRVTEQLLKLKLVELTLHPEPDLTQTKTLVDLLEKIRAGKLAERKLALAESKQ